MFFYVKSHTPPKISHNDLHMMSAVYNSLSTKIIKMSFCTNLYENRTDMLQIMQSKKNCLIFEDGTDRSSRNVSTELPSHAAWNPKRAQISWHDWHKQTGQFQIMQFRTYYLNNTCRLYTHSLQAQVTRIKTEIKKNSEAADIFYLQARIPSSTGLKFSLHPQQVGQHHDRLLSSRYGFSRLLLVAWSEHKLPRWKCQDGFSPAYAIPQFFVIFTNTIHQMNNTGISVKFIL
jgi:hypothetical protein